MSVQVDGMVTEIEPGSFVTLYKRFSSGTAVSVWDGVWMGVGGNVGDAGAVVAEGDGRGRVAVASRASGVGGLAEEAHATVRERNKVKPGENLRKTFIAASPLPFRLGYYRESSTVGSGLDPDPPHEL